MLDEFRRFTNQFRVEKGQPFTHTSIGNPRVSLNVPEDRMPEFYDQYRRAIIRGTALHLTEKPGDPSPMRADLDFRFTLPSREEEGEPTEGEGAPMLPRLYEAQHVENILRAYFEVLYAYLDVPEEALVAYVMEKPGPSEHRSKMKDGLHIVWPYLVVPHRFQHLVRKKIVDAAPSVLAGLPVCNSYEDIFDQAIIDKNNWQMYGSRKPDCPTYRVTAIYQYRPTPAPANGSKKKRGAAFAPELVLLDGPSPSDELELVELLSMRHKEYMGVPYRDEEKEQEVEEYVNRVLPTVDDRRKTKLHSLIFGKSRNLEKNHSGEDDYELAKKLVMECLSSRRREDYDSWIRLGWALRNIDYRLLDVWTEFSRNSSKYIDGECQQLWDKMRIDTLGMGTLRCWARDDNPQQYEEILKRNVTALVDISINSDGAHYDVARVVHTMFKDEYRFTSKDTWYIYRPEKHRWVRTREGLMIRNALSNEICRIYMRRSDFWTGESLRQNDDSRLVYEDRGKKASAIAHKLKTSSYKDSVMKECKCLFTDDRFEELLDSQPHLLGFENGVYDLKMHEFRDGMPDDYISFTTKRHYIPYDPESQEGQEIEQYLSQVFINPEMKHYIKDLLATVIDGSLKADRFYVFTGTGANSKSMCLDLLQKAIGEYYCILPIALLTQKRTASNAAQAELERTKGRRCAVLQEPGEAEKLNIGLMKEMSGGDLIQCRGLFKEPIEFRPQFKMIMTCNELPEVNSDDDGTWRRIRVVHFASRFCDNPDPNKPNEFPLDPNLVERTETWADTFISMLIDHHKKIDPKKIKEPDAVKAATDLYKRNNDLIGQYVTDRIIVDPSSTQRLTFAKIYQDFKTWAFHNLSRGKRLPERNQIQSYLEKKFGVCPPHRGWSGIRYAPLGNAEEENSDSDAEGAGPSS